MSYKKVISLFLFAALFLILVQSLVSAGCCLDSCEDYSSGCSDYNNNNNCDEITDCSIGCCCVSGSSVGVGTLGINCNTDAGYTFLKQSDLFEYDSCSCEASGYSISGEVRYMGTASPVQGATVTSGGVTTHTDSYGAFLLEDIPGGSSSEVRVVAETCKENIYYYDLSSDLTNKILEVDCESCNSGSCDFEKNAFCVNGHWDVYQLTDTFQEYEYCYEKGCYEDPECEAEVECVAGDGFCHPSCTVAQDSDCACNSNQYNGVCPSTCDSSNDLDCGLQVASCGNSRIEYPFETCETDEIGGRGGLCDYSVCNPSTCLCPPGEYNSACGNGRVEPDKNEECELGMVCSDGIPCSDSCTCASSCTMRPLLNAEFNKDEGKIYLSWSFDPACAPAGAYFNIYRCISSDENSCSDYADVTQIIGSTYDFTFIDGGIPADNSQYYYVVEANILGTIKKSSITAVKSGDAFCFNKDEDDLFCYGNAIAKCEDSSMSVSVVQACAEGTSCMLYFNNQPQCISMTRSICEQCNGLFGLFAHKQLELKTIDVDEQTGFEEEITWKCTDQDYVGGAAYPLKGTCYLDKSIFGFQAFKSCSEVTSCYDFKSESACLADTCDKLSEDCEWNWISNADNELGGVCRPKPKELQKCNFCSITSESPRYNWLSSFCTRDVCNLFGQECYLTGSSSSAKCSNKEGFSCKQYPTQQECVGSNIMNLDIKYNSTGDRTGGTHELTTPSGDSLGLGKCVWYSAQSVCLRDADANFGGYSAGELRGADCEITSSIDWVCETDFDNPETTIVTKPIYPANLVLDFAVSDNTYSGDKVKTFVCIDPPGNLSVCYPTLDDEIKERKFSFSAKNSGDYKVRFYSQDFAKNLEVVKTQTILVDSDFPTISILSPSLDELNTNQRDVQLFGVASLDTNYLCVYPRGSSTSKRCISNCEYYESASGTKASNCIDSSTGAFDIVIDDLSSDALYDILVDIEDFAGNLVSGWSLLAIYHNETPPREPTITIRGVS